jgi:Na+(H+)/acetate symporter ActP
VITSVAVAALLLALACATVVAMARGGPLSRTAGDLFVAGRRVGPAPNSAAIAGGLLPAVSLLGIVGAVARDGAGGLWFVVGPTAGIVVVLLFIAGPLRRFGGHTVADFAQGRLDSAGARATTALSVLAIGFALTVPLLQAAGTLLMLSSGVPYGIGVTVVGVTVSAGVVLGGMRSATRVQTLHFWVGLFAIAIPVLALLVVAGAGGAGAVSDGVATLARPAVVRSSVALVGTTGGDASLLYTYSLLVALVCGTAGLPQLLVRFYSSPDGRQARRTAARSVGLVSASLLVSAALGALVRTAMVPGATDTGGDASLLMLPGRMLVSRGLPAAGGVLAAILAVGALAAVIGALAGLLVSVSATLAHDVLPRASASRADAPTSPARFRLSAAAAGAMTIGLGLAVEGAHLSVLVGWAFVLAASTVFPLMVLGMWFRGLTKAGAIAGMIAGGGATVGSAVLAETIARGLLSAPAAFTILAAQPAILTVPLAFVLMLVVSRATRSMVPADADARMLRLHAPEQLGLRSDYIED